MLLGPPTGIKMGWPDAYELFGMLPPSLAVAPKVAPSRAWLVADFGGRLWNGKSPKLLIYLGLSVFSGRLWTSAK